MGRLAIEDCGCCLLQACEENEGSTDSSLMPLASDFQFTFS
jgi:hypothetical protein